MNYNRLFGFICFIFIWNTGFSQVYEDTKSQSMRYKANASTQVDILNKYGTVLVTTWEKDSVLITVNQKISEKSESRFAKTKENINVEFSESAGTINAHTIFGAKYSTLVKDVAEATNYLSASGNQTKIEYHLFVPEYVNIAIDNKYGDVILPSLKGNIKVTLANGNLQCRAIDGQAEFNLSFGNAEINHIRQANISLNFVQCNIKDAGSLTLNGKSSEVYVESVETLRLNSRRDNITINNASTIYGETYFSKVNILKVNNECQLHMTYGDLTSLTMDKNFKKMDIISNACNVNISLMQPTAYNALIKAKSSTYKLPPELKSTIDNYATQIEEMPISFIYKLKQPTARVKINVSGADILLKHQ